MKILLDIDEVMVHANPTKQVKFNDDGFYEFNDSATKALQAVCSLSTSSEIILSTSHRFRYSITEWHKIFKKRGISVEKISRIEEPVNMHKSRKLEIVNWIEKNKIDINNLIIIDDDKSLNSLHSPLKERLFLTDPYMGLNISILESTVLKNLY